MPPLSVCLRPLTVRRLAFASRAWARAQQTTIMHYEKGETQLITEHHLVHSPDVVIGKPRIAWEGE